METGIITHRGLDPSRTNYFPESSLAAFSDHLGRGFGIEFDVHFLQNGTTVASHSKEVSGHNPTIPEVLSLITRMQRQDVLSAIHLKHTWQSPAFLDVLLHEIKVSNIHPSQFIIFDAKPTSALYIKEKMPRLQLAASVAHPYDIERYNTVVGGTLLSMDELLAHKHLYTWAWLDEWDLVDRDGGKKKFCTEETFNILRENRILIALVTPELHASSPGLLGGEAHEDGIDMERLKSRFLELKSLTPNAVCTDYPDMWKS